jgi:hypothetical protein
VIDKPLGEALDTIARETGIRFSLDSRWKKHPVSASVKGLSLEKALKRLLRSLNHTIVWQSEDSITITIFGEAEQGGANQAVSFAAPPQEVSEDPEPLDEIEDEIEQDELDEPEADRQKEGDASDAGATPSPPGEVVESGE